MYPVVAEDLEIHNSEAENRPLTSGYVDILTRVATF